METPSPSDKDLRKLLLTFVLSDGDSSVAAFDAWERNVVYDDSSFESFKLLPAVYLKLQRLNISSRLFLRIKGAHRRTWTENQLLLTQLKELFDDLNTSQIKFVVSDEAIRLTEIYEDVGILSLQNFSIVAPTSQRKDLRRSLIENRWEIFDDAVERTQCKKDKTLDINVKWVSEEQFAELSKDAETISVGDNVSPVLCSERQILDLCENRYLVQGDEESSWQFITCALFNAGSVDHSRMIALAQRRHLTRQLAQMLESLVTDYAADVPPYLLDELRNSPLPGRLSMIRKQYNNVKNDYQMYLEDETRSSQRTNIKEFLEQRWQADSYRAMARHGLRSCIRLWQAR